MSDNSEYLHVYELLGEFERHDCPECAESHWFKETDFDGRSALRCLECRSTLHDTLEVPCPECGSRMLGDGDSWHCRLCDVRVDRDRSEMIDSMTGEFETAGGYDRDRFHECPVCGERSVRCGPDGERVCDECGRLYLGRFSDAWFAYVEWLSDRETVRVVA